MMHPRLSLALTALFLHEAWAFSLQYPLCMAEPVLALDAGRSTLSAVQCAGLAPSCNHGVISGGRADSSIPSEADGQVGCLVETFETKTTLATVTRSSRTFVETVPTVLVTSSTSFLSAPIETKTQSSGPPDTDSTEPAKSTGPSTSDGSSAASGSSTASSAVETLEVPREEAKTTSTERQTTGDGVFESTASKMSTTLVPALTASIVSTLTVYHTVTAKCTAS
ncbi:hypothetical protein LCI18_003616 [Fusarium solani-melongenae]|uniref:Uncharacterized protein n=1 Tax=Fusarium solani subsp. cucurbitae TaxID=2747967 RepID=A0ACD3YUS0_FUSSC|nr:hypothetical protein LCI18_003616 [Fusarium solani-melongenae]